LSRRSVILQRMERKVSVTISFHFGLFVGSIFAQAVSCRCTFLKKGKGDQFNWKRFNFWLLRSANLCYKKCFNLQIIIIFTFFYVRTIVCFLIWTNIHCFFKTINLIFWSYITKFQRLKVCRHVEFKKLCYHKLRMKTFLI